MVKNILIIGKGSVSTKHKLAIKLISKKIKVTNLSSKKFSSSFLNKNFFDLIVVCSPSSFHFKHLQMIEKKIKNTKVLIEKPLFDKFYNIRIDKLKNQYFVGYNLRFHPVIKFLKKKIVNKKIFSVNILAHSYLPLWRKKNYNKSVSASKKLGGGVLLELSHELDYLKWIFKKINIFTVFNKKISNLNINTDDVLNVSGILNKKTFFNLNTNFFSRIERRSIKIDGKDFSIDANLIENNIKINNGKKIINKHFSKFNILNTYKEQYLNIFSKKKINTCTLKQGLELMKLIQKIKSHD